jgi:hypothetical protein
VLPRAILALIAVVLIAWFSVLARNHVVGWNASLRIVAEPKMDAAEWKRAMDDFRSAESLDPSTDWSIIRAQYWLLRDKRMALRVADSVLRREPDNLAAWSAVLRASDGVQPARHREAIMQIRRLNPPPG